MQAAISHNINPIIGGNRALSFFENCHVTCYVIIFNPAISLQNKALSKSISADLVNLQGTAETPPHATSAPVAIAA